MLLPCTTAYERIGHVPPGLVLVSRVNCPVFNKTGFTKDAVMINIRQAFTMTPEEYRASGAVQIGCLDLDAAPRVKALMAQAIKEFPILIGKSA